MATNSFDIAIIGMAGRFPRARNVAELWTLLRDGEEAIRELSCDELEASGVPRRDFESPSYVRAGALLEEFDLFDAGFFGMSPKEAELTDPQHRVFLECAWDALEHAGTNLDTYDGSVGVFAGASASTYLLFHMRPSRHVFGAPGYFPLMIGNDKDYLATRVSYRLNLRGPSITVQTACSTSLVAVHLACQSLLAGECDLALAGGVAISVPHVVGHWFEEGAYFSPDGHCRAFDASARGTLFGNGAGVVVLKGLDAAVAAGDPIAAVIKGTAINNDGGTKVGFTAPSVRGQAEVVAQALAVAGVSPQTIGYVEAHGTGTPLGDPIEVAALRQAFGDAGGRGAWCALGSVKTNLGHLDSAAGIAGLIKTVLCLQHRELVPSLHFRTANPGIAFAGSPFYVNTRRQAWPKAAGVPRRAGVSSFGIGGTNAHIVLEEAPPEPSPAPSPSPAVTSPAALSWIASPTVARRTVRLLPLSARSASALEAQRRQWETFLATASPAAMAAIGYTAAVRRSAHRYRLAVIGDTVAAWRIALQSRGSSAIRGIGAATSTGAAVGTDMAALGGSGAAITGVGAQAAATRLPIGWVFAGQGSLAAPVGEELWRDEPAFRAAATAAIAALARAGWRRAELFETPLTANEQVDPAIVQPVLFAVQWSLAALWRHWGVTPAAVVGHSLGEVAAACVVDALSLEAGARVVVERSRLLATRRDSGAMVAVALGPEALAARLAGTALTLAACNSPTSCVVAGPADAVAAWVPTLPADVPCRWLPTGGVAGHSPQVAGLDEALTTRLFDLRPQVPTRPYYSAVEGGEVRTAAFDATYWGRNLRTPVQFASALTAALDAGVTTWLELSAHPMLTLAVIECAGTRPVLAVSSLTRDGGERSALLASAGRLWEAGATLDWTALAGPPAPVVPLPAYPWQRQRYWIEPSTQGDEPRRLRRLNCSFAPRMDLFEADLSIAAFPAITGHRLNGTVVVPGSLYLALAIEAARELLGPGDLRLTRIMFCAALFIADDEHRTLQLAVSRHAHGVRIECRTRACVAARGRHGEGEAPWILHATLSAETASAETLSAETLSAETLSAELASASNGSQARRIAGDHNPPAGSSNELYAGLDHLGIELTGAFRLIDSVRREQNAAECTVVDAAPPMDSVESLDLVNQALAAALDVGSQGARDPALPVSIEALWCAASMATASPAIVRATATSDRSGDVTVYAKTGDPLVRATALHAQPMTAHRTWHRIAWEPAPMTTEAPDRDTTWLVIAGDDRLASPLIGQLRDAGCRRVIRASATDDPARLCEDAADSTHAIGAIFVAPSSPEPAHETALCMDVARTIQALSAVPHVRSRLWIVTRGTQAVHDGDIGEAGVHAAGLNGMIQVIALEHPEMRPVQIDLDPRAEAQAARVIAELAAPGVEHCVAWRGGTRLVARLERFVPRALRPFSIDPSRSICITGGFGGLGLELAAWLGTHGCRHLVLVGRSAPTPAQRARLDALERDGLDIHVFRADVSTRRNLQPILDAAGRDWPALQGIFHLAGHLDDRTLQRMDPDHIARVFAPKVAGAWLLHELTLDRALDYFVVFSSAGAIVGSAGQASHAAANAAMDGLAHYRRSLGLPALSINWGPWNRAGKAYEQGRLSHLAQLGIEAMEPAEALSSLELLLAADEIQAGVFRCDPDRFARLYPEASRAPFLERVLRRRDRAGSVQRRASLLSGPASDRRRALVTHVRDVAAEVLRIDPAAVGADDPLSSHGMDSLRALELRHVLEETLGTPFSAALVWRYPTVRLLAAGLAEALDATPPAVIEPAEVLGPPAAVAIVASAALE